MNICVHKNMDCQSCCWVVIKENSCTKNKLAAPDINNNNNDTNTINDGNINNIYFHIREKCWDQQGWKWFHGFYNHCIWFLINENGHRSFMIFKANSFLEKYLQFQNLVILIKYFLHIYKMSNCSSSRLQCNETQRSKSDAICLYIILLSFQKEVYLFLH